MDDSEDKLVKSQTYDCGYKLRVYQNTNSNKRSSDFLDAKDKLIAEMYKDRNQNTIIINVTEQTVHDEALQKYPGVGTKILEKMIKNATIWTVGPTGMSDYEICSKIHSKDSVTYSGLFQKAVANIQNDDEMSADIYAMFSDDESITSSTSSQDCRAAGLQIKGTAPKNKAKVL